MYCPQCGSQNDESVAFCATCGKDLMKYKEQWSTSAGAAASATDGGDAGTGSDSREAGGEPGRPPQEQQPGPGPSASPPPYQQQYQPGYQAQPPYQTGTGYPPGGYYPPAGYRPPTYPPGYGPGYPPKVPSYLGWAIATLFAFWPTAIVAIVFATKVDSLLHIGDVWGAQEASRKAKMWCWISFGIGVAGLVIAIIIAIVAAVATVSVFETY